jgi:hypothetical protein
MSSQPGADRPTGKAPRRAVRRAGTVGTDDAVLLSTLPAFPADAPPPVTEPPTADGSPAGGARPASGGATDPAVALRSADDSDVGWGGGTDSNDDRLHRDRPPHW